MVCIWVLHLYQRRYREEGARKRAATQWLTFLIIGMWAAAWLFRQLRVGDEWLIVVTALAAGLLVWQHEAMLPFRRRCARCRKPVGLESMMCRDSNRCEACEPHTTEGEAPR